MISPRFQPKYEDLSIRLIAEIWLVNSQTNSVGHKSHNLLLTLIGTVITDTLVTVMTHTVDSPFWKPMAVFITNIETTGRAILICCCSACWRSLNSKLRSETGIHGPPDQETDFKAGFGLHVVAKGSWKNRKVGNIQISDWLVNREPKLERSIEVGKRNFSNTFRRYFPT